jgi:surface antigen
MRGAREILVATVLLLCAAGALAQNVGFMRKGPVAYLSETEQGLLRDAVRAAVNDTADGGSVDWGDLDAGTGGSIKVLDTHEDYGTTCRTIRSRMQAGGRSGGGDYRLCRADDGSWRFAPARRPAP